VRFCDPDDGRETRLKHVERLTETNNLRKVSSCWLYPANILAMHGSMNVKFSLHKFHIIAHTVHLYQVIFLKFFPTVRVI